MADATVNIKVTDLEPFARFISRIATANAAFRGLSAEEAKTLPANAVKGIAELQDALAELGKKPAARVRTEGSQPNQVNITMNPRPEAMNAALVSAMGREQARVRRRTG
jgi:hypothetical protein